MGKRAGKTPLRGHTAPRIARDGTSGLDVDPRSADASPLLAHVGLTQRAIERVTAGLGGEGRFCWRGDALKVGEAATGELSPRATLELPA